jgi:hypothetical protein
MSNTPQSPSVYKRATLFSLLVALILIIGWPISMIISWSSIVNDDCRLAYMISDLGLVSPLFVASWIGLRSSATWGPLLFLVAIGALSYDVLHFGIYLIRMKFLDIPAIVYVALVAIILLIIFLLVRGIIRNLSNP